MKRTRRLLAALLCAAVVIAACGDDDADNSAENGVGSATEPPENIDRDGTLTLAYFLDSPVGYDPHLHSTGSDNIRTGLVYDYLLMATPDGLEPQLATSWEWAEDSSYLELELREDVQFHDGAEFDASAAKASLDRALTLEGSTAVQLLTSVEEVEVVEDYVLRIHTSSPDALLPSALAWPGSAGAMISPDAIDNDDLATKPVGAGRFRLIDWEEGVGSTLERFDDYWDVESVDLARIEMKIIPDASARLNALRTGEVDLTPIDSNQIDEAEQDGLAVEAAPGLTLEGLLLNRANEGLDDERVRQALNFAVDREAIAEGLHFGYSTPIAQFYGPGSRGYSERAAEVYEHDPERARELLTEAGYEDGYTFEVLVPSVPAMIALGEVLEQQFQEAGITMEIRQIDVAQIGPLFYSEKQGAALVASPFPVDTEPLRTPQVFLDPASAVGNPGAHTTPEWEDLIARASATLDPDERAPLVEELMYQNVLQAGNVIVGAPHQGWAMDDRVLGFEPPSTYPDLRGVAVSAS